MAGSSDQKFNLMSNSDTNDDQRTGDLLSSMKSYFLSGEFSDLTICTVDREIKVHRLVVCGQSEFFSRLYKRSWIEDDPQAIEAMIRFMYGLDYYDNSSHDRGCNSPLLFNIRLYQVADKYTVPQLKRRAQETFETVAKRCWQMDDFSTAIAEAYECTTPADRGLRGPLVEISLKHLRDFLTQNNPPSSKVTRYCCPHCAAVWLFQSCIGKPLKLCPFCGLYQGNWSD
ncbi:BTB/POZ domain-containing protein [Aspergillus ibericus CBS 121593]|uniref:BTB domain-containing protein n=1 Tax=Aspergillus ibericus CBS 121593 TaxID=1448316 RepID=A0A395H735_9EURO|nr:hypothetical protein BO80DRAFT_453138 [Aspergillus ibericus CBS 121593]RAL03460.1 hypothetical protein BO80DRAFT_453138 [Aspergillus ibericus CBS 121593]